MPIHVIQGIIFYSVVKCFHITLCDIVEEDIRMPNTSRIPFNLWCTSEVSKLHPKNTFGPLPVFVNNILLKHCHTYSRIAHGCLHATTAHLSSWDRDGMGRKAKSIYDLALYRKSRPIICIYYTLVTNLSITKDTIASFLCNNHTIQDI